MHLAGLVMNKEERAESVKVDGSLGMRGPGRQAECASVGGLLWWQNLTT